MSTVLLLSRTFLNFIHIFLFESESNFNFNRKSSIIEKFSGFVVEREPATMSSFLASVIDSTSQQKVQNIQSADAGQQNYLEIIPSSTNNEIVSIKDNRICYGENFNQTIDTNLVDNRNIANDYQYDVNAFAFENTLNTFDSNADVNAPINPTQYFQHNFNEQILHKTDFQTGELFIHLINTNFLGKYFS